MSGEYRSLDGFRTLEEYEAYLGEFNRQAAAPSKSGPQQQQCQQQLSQQQQMMQAPPATGTPQKGPGYKMTDEDREYIEALAGARNVWHLLDLDI